MSAVATLERPLTDKLAIRPLQPTIGAEIAGIDLRAPLSDADRDEIKAALLKHKVVFFRDQRIDRDQHIAFASRFGEIYTPPYAATKPIDGAPGLHLIAANQERKQAAQPDEVKWPAYHTDTSWRLVPSWGAILRAVDLPPLGGDTIWVDAGLAYRELPEDVKARLEGLYAVADFQEAIRKTGHEYPLVSHPIVRTHRETGEKILWVDYVKRPQILGLDRDEGRELLRIINDQYARPEYQVRFNWKPGSIAFWDNRAAVHYAVRNYGDYPRVLERVLVADEPLWRDL